MSSFVHTLRLTVLGTVFILLGIFLSFVSLHSFHWIKPIRQGDKTPFFDPDQVKLLNTNEGNSTSTLATDFGTKRLNKNPVVMVLVDGLRFDTLGKHKELYSLFYSPQYENDLKLWKLESEIPTKSLPNYVSILTGSPPEMTGVMDNVGVLRKKEKQSLLQILRHEAISEKTDKPIPYETILDRARQHGLTMTYNSDLSPDNSDHYPLVAWWLGLFTDISKERVPEMWPPAHPKDVVQEILNNADFSLYHYCGVDLASHSFGVKSEEFRASVTRLARVLRELFRSVDETTVVVIAADHGHVDEGGHGGVERHVLEVPFFVYRKGSGLRYVTAEHAAEFQGTVSNFGLSRSNQARTRDIAPTLSALLGIPVPRQNQGLFLDDAFLFSDSSLSQETSIKQYRDLYFSYLRLYWVYRDTILRKYEGMMQVPPISRTQLEAVDLNDIHSIGKATLLLHDIFTVLRQEWIESYDMHKYLAMVSVPLMAMFLAGIVYFSPLSSIPRMLHMRLCALSFIHSLFYFCGSFVLYILMFSTIYRTDEEVIMDRSQFDGRNRSSHAIFTLLLGFPITLFMGISIVQEYLLIRKAETSSTGQSYYQAISSINPELDDELDDDLDVGGDVAVVDMAAAAETDSPSAKAPSQDQEQQGHDEYEDEEEGVHRSERNGTAFEEVKQKRIHSSIVPKLRHTKASARLDLLFATYGLLAVCVCMLVWMALANDSYFMLEGLLDRPFLSKEAYQMEKVSHIFLILSFPHLVICLALFVFALDNYIHSIDDPSEMKKVD